MLTSLCHLLEALVWWRFISKNSTQAQPQGGCPGCGMLKLLVKTFEDQGRSSDSLFTSLSFLEKNTQISLNSLTTRSPSRTFVISSFHFYLLAYLICKPTYNHSFFFKLYTCICLQTGLLVCFGRLCMLKDYPENLFFPTLMTSVKLKYIQQRIQRITLFLHQDLHSCTNLAWVRQVQLHTTLFHVSIWALVLISVKQGQLQSNVFSHIKAVVRTKEVNSMLSKNLEYIQMYSLIIISSGIDSILAPCLLPSYFSLYASASGVWSLVCKNFHRHTPCISLRGLP